MLEPASNYEVAEESGMNSRNSWSLIDDMHPAKPVKLVYRARWERQTDGGPPLPFYRIGSKRDAPRPRAFAEREYNARAGAKRKALRIVGLVRTDPWVVMRNQLSA